MASLASLDVTAFVATVFNINVPYLLILFNVHSLTLDQKELKVSELICCLVRTVGGKKENTIIIMVHYLLQNQ